MIVKVKEPQLSECQQLRPGQILFTYLHLAPDPQQAKALMASGATCIAYETVTSATGGLPLLAPMSEVAGRMAIQAGAYFLEKPHGGLGVLLGGVPGVAPAKVVILGGGVVGSHAAMIAAGMGLRCGYWIATSMCCAICGVNTAVPSTRNMPPAMPSRPTARMLIW